LSRDFCVNDLIVSFFFPPVSLVCSWGKDNSVVLDAAESLDDNRLSDGDIVIISAITARRLPCASWLAFLSAQERLFTVEFRPCMSAADSNSDEDTDKDTPSKSTKEAIFKISADLEADYHAVLDIVSRETGIAATRLRLVTHDNDYDRPETVLGAKHLDWTLRDMLMRDDKIRATNALYYQHIPCSLEEFESYIMCGVTVLDVTSLKMTDQHILYLPRASFARDVVAAARNQLTKKAGANASVIQLPVDDDDVLVLVTQQGKIVDVLDLDAPLGNGPCKLRLEAVEKTPHHWLQCRLFHYSQWPASTHGVPLLVSLSPDDTVGELRARLQKKFHVGDKEWSRWKLGYLMPRAFSVIPLNDDAAPIPFDDLRLGAHLAIDHPNTSARGSVEQSVKIHN
jgi:hypothetical protein